MSFFMDESAKP